MQQIKRKETDAKELVLPVNEGPVNLVDSSHHTPATENRPVSTQDKMTYSELKESRSLAFLQYTALSQTFQQFSLRSADNLLVQNNPRLESLIGLLGAEIASIQEILFSKEKSQPEQLTDKETKYLRSLLKTS